MAKVKVSTKFPITGADADLLDENKRNWWMKCNTTNTFVDVFPKTPCTSPIDVELDLPDGEYTMGCGSWSVVNEAGRHVSQKVNFYISGGKIHYCKWNEFPSVTHQNGMPKADSAEPSQKPKAYSPWGATASAEAPSEPSAGQSSAQAVIPQMERIDASESVYCIKNKKFTIGDYNCVTDFEARDSSGVDSCINCTQRRLLCYAVRLEDDHE